MDVRRAIIVGVAAFGLLGCVSAEEQRAMDLQRCGGFGFAPGSDGMANCLLSVTQQREAEAAAERRAFEQNRLISDQRNREREVAERSRRDAADEARRDDFMKSFNAAPAGFGMPSINPANCRATSGANAGSLTCN